MYGYVVPKKDNLAMQDFVLYRSFYCGICKATGSVYGQFPRFTTNYDMVFLSVLLHDCMSQEVEFKNGGCVLNPFKKKVTVCRNELLDKIVSTNILLSYYKVKDDIADKDGRGKKIVRAFLKKAYLRAAAHMPKIESIIKKNYGQLAVFETAGEPSIDKAANCFSQLLMEIAAELLGSKADDNILKLCYNVGKFVYLVDAIDDINDDYKKKRYNPFLSQFGGFVNRRQFITDNNESIKFILSVTVNRAIECFNSIHFEQSYDLLKNIVHVGLRDKCEQILDSQKKLPKPRI